MYVKPGEHPGCPRRWHHVTRGRHEVRSEGGHLGELVLRQGYPLRQWFQLQGLSQRGLRAAPVAAQPMLAGATLQSFELWRSRTRLVGCDAADP